jgi:hypothetical protein
MARCRTDGHSCGRWRVGYLPGPTDCGVRAARRRLEGCTGSSVNTGFVNPRRPIIPDVICGLTLVPETVASRTDEIDNPIAPRRGTNPLRTQTHSFGASRYAPAVWAMTFLEGATGVPPNSAGFGDVVALIVAVTQPVAVEYDWFENVAHLVPSHQVRDRAPGPQNVRTTLSKLLPWPGRHTGRCRWPGRGKLTGWVLMEDRPGPIPSRDPVRRSVPPPCRDRIQANSVELRHESALSRRRRGRHEHPF